MTHVPPEFLQREPVDRNLVSVLDIAFHQIAQRSGSPRGKDRNHERGPDQREPRVDFLRFRYVPLVMRFFQALLRGVLSFLRVVGIVSHIVSLPHDELADRLLKMLQVEHHQRDNQGH